MVNGEIGGDLMFASGVKAVMAGRVLEQCASAINGGGALKLSQSQLTIQKD